jgi:hypothetical protein
LACSDDTHPQDTAHCGFSPLASVAHQSIQRFILFTSIFSSGTSPFLTTLLIQVRLAALDGELKMSDVPGLLQSAQNNRFDVW